MPTTQRETRLQYCEVLKEQPVSIFIAFTTGILKLSDKAMYFQQKNLAKLVFHLFQVEEGR